MLPTTVRTLTVTVTHVTYHSQHRLHIKPPTMYTMDGKLIISFPCLAFNLLNLLLVFTLLFNWTFLFHYRSLSLPELFKILHFALDRHITSLLVCLLNFVLLLYRFHLHISSAILYQVFAISYLFLVLPNVNLKHKMLCL